MADHTKIEWTDATWNPITGCTLVSHGCRNCYAAQLAATRLKDHPSRTGLARVNADGVAKFTGEVRFNPQWLDQPLQWSRPRMIFVCAHGDLFHEGVQREWLVEIFARIVLAPQHIYQILTKRPARQREILSDATFGRQVYERVCDLTLERELAVVLIAEPAHERYAPAGRRIHLGVWPLPNVWLGTSVEDQATAEERIPELLATPAAVRWISAEPLLGPINIVDAMWSGSDHPADHLEATLDWVVVGGESGRHARPMHPDWARSLRDQCATAGVPFLFKQWGEWAPSTPEKAAGNPRSGWRCLAGHPHVPKAAELYPEAGAAFIEHMGKKAAGRLLDGVEHNGFPEVRRGQ